MSRKPKYDPNYHPHAVKVLRIGKYYDKEIIAEFDISGKTFYRWLKDKPEFREAYDHGATKLLSQTMSKILEVAMGYEHEETHQEVETDAKGTVVKKKMKKIKKHVPPNASLLLWLACNLDPTLTRNPKSEKVEKNDNDSIINLKNLTTKELIQRATAAKTLSLE